ncbi:hypothetical protein CEXT_457611 [Caerostris extrusa]|uniref:Uncharacterized protein n=1 Tax=Caerostris extrusa TaxID=172846 RepID=A0AAV4PXM9_CAEEX|nr:hypothetical protein CEXT_457611 [Caerostris extrusa]
MLSTSVIFKSDFGLVYVHIHKKKKRSLGSVSYSGVQWNVRRVKSAMDGHSSVVVIQPLRRSVLSESPSHHFLEEKEKKKKR